MSNAVWTVRRQVGGDTGWLQGIFSSRYKMINAIEKEYDEVVWNTDEKGKPFRADCDHHYFGHVILWFTRVKLDELKR